MGKDPRTTATVIHLALLGGQLVFAAVAIMIERSVPPPEDLSADILLPVVASTAVLAIIIAHIMGRVLLRAAHSRDSESERMMSGLRAFIVRMAVLEAGSLFAIVAYILTGETVFLGMFAVVFAAFLFSRPSETEWERIQSGSQSGNSSTNLPPSIS